MGSRLQALFGADHETLTRVYGEFVESLGTSCDNTELLRCLVEVGVRFGERVFRVGSKGFVEIGCGTAIPSLTLAKMGNHAGKAVDVDPKVLTYAEKIRDLLGLRLDIQCFDVFENRPKMGKGFIVIAEKPASYKKNPLEVEYSIANRCKIEGYDLAMIPSYTGQDTLESYSNRCDDHARKLRQVGFKVENKQVFEKLPLRWIVAVKSPGGSV